MDLIELEGRRCGNCRLWGRNFYRVPNRSCCADAVMDLPASFIPNRQVMDAEDGDGCIAWEPTDPPLAVGLKQVISGASWAICASLGAIPEMPIR